MTNLRFPDEDAANGRDGWKEKQFTVSEKNSVSVSKDKEQEQGQVKRRNTLPFLLVINRVYQMQLEILLSIAQFEGHKCELGHPISVEHHKLSQIC